MNITKSCSTDLVSDSNKVVVEVSVSGTFCNNGDIKLNNIVLTDDMGTVDTSDDFALDVGTMLKVTCQSYSHSFYPSIPSLTYSDTVDVSGIVILGLGTVDNSASATCGLCP